MGNFTFEETNLLCIYNTGSRTGLIEALTEMRGELSPEEAELRELTDSAQKERGKGDLIWETSLLRKRTFFASTTTAAAPG